MAFESFKEKIERYLEPLGATAKYEVNDNGYTAKCSNGVTFTGNSICKKLSVKWGSGHLAMV